MILNTPLTHRPVVEKAESFCPSNIALCKYWGKRDQTLNLPNNSSLSISLGKFGTRTSVSEGVSDMLVIDGKRITIKKPEHIRLFKWIDVILGSERPHLYINTFSNIPTGAGVASSASSFSSILKAMNAFFGWNLKNSLLSHFARLGSCSAARSLHRGFVHLEAGSSPNGEDFHVMPLSEKWNEFRIAIYYINIKPKPVSSREGMNLTTATSPIYQGWVEYAEQSCKEMIKAIRAKDFSTLGGMVERNSLMMHGTMMGCNPPLIYLLPESLEALQQIRAAREQGIEVYATLDAGPNIKLLFLEKDEKAVKQLFPEADVIAPFLSPF
jgi:diphosphomevalonate decarboxylase